MMFWPSSGSSREPSSSVGRPNIAGSGRGLVGVVGRDRALVADHGDELGHRRPHAAALVGLADVRARGQRRLAVGQELGRRRLVRDEGADLLRVAGDQGQRVDRAAAAREEVDRSGAERRDQPVQVVGMLVGRRLGGAVGARLRSTPRGS